LKEAINLYKEKWYHSPWTIGILFAFWLFVIPPIVAIILIVQRRKELKKSQMIWETSGIDDLIKVKDEKKKIESEISSLQLSKEEAQNELKEYQPLIDLNKTKETLNQQLSFLNTDISTSKELLKEYEPIINLSNTKSVIEAEIDSLTVKRQEETNILMTLQQDMIDLKEELLMQSFGFYEPKYGFDNSEVYQNKLNEIRQKQKQLVKDKTATNHRLDWTIGNDAKRGKEFILDTIKLTLRAFNNECDNAIARAKYNNIEVVSKRINKVFEDLNKLTDMQQVSIRREYLELKIEELYLKFEFEQKKQEEKEEQLEIKERMREEAKALKELEKAKEKVEKEEKHFLQAIEKLNDQISTTEIGNQEKLLAKLRELELQLEETQKNKEDVLYRVQNTRAGYVYIISNLGSFGENVYKIGMTRRLEPMDRVKELGDASVPFTFDVHAMIFSDDAPSLENAIHKALAHNKVNKVNDRKEFFRVQLSEIEELVKRNHNKTIEFTKLAEAEEFRKSQTIDKKKLQEVS
jgi:Domain of unknown function (DUF4041)/T5orf172 domain